MAGKVMFRDFALLTPDYSVRAQDGYLIFRWWRSYVPKDVSEDLSNSDTRLSVQLNGFELHTYNRSHVYRDLEKKFGLEPGLLPGEDDEEEVEEKEDEGGGASLGTDWRDLIPVIKVDISTCKFVFGNRLLPTTLLVTVEEAHFTYSTKPASTSLDHFMHFVKTKAENLKVVLAESPKYTGLRAHDEAPRYMGEGFVVLASNQVRLFYHKNVSTNCTTYITSTTTCNICTTYAACTTCASYTTLVLPGAVVLLPRRGRPGSRAHPAAHNCQRGPCRACFPLLGLGHHLREGNRLQLRAVGGPAERDALQVLLPSRLPGWSTNVQCPMSKEEVGHHQFPAKF